MKETADQNENFYDNLAPFYKYVYPDWEKSVRIQAEVLDKLVREKFSGKVNRILDASCGIGTQLIGLAESGYDMTGADISANELKVAAEELKKYGLFATLHHCGFADLNTCFDDPFDIVVSFDNAIPHLLNDKEILAAFRNMFKLCRFGIMISVRDYDQIDKSGIQLVPYGYRMIGSKKMFLFQRWEFEGEINRVSFFFLDESAGVSGRMFRTSYYAIKTSKLMKLMEEAGFSDTECLKTGFFQPVIIAKK